MNARIIFLVAVCAVAVPEECHGMMDFWEFAFGPRLGSREGTPRNSDQRSAEKLAASFGYRLETHQVTSDTGHIVTLHRIPSGRRNGNSTKPATLILHGLLASSDAWLQKGPKFGLGYLLADAGYDVWLLNIRGNVYSRNHKTLDPNRDASYWQFGVEEVGYYDLAATIDYILKTTEQQKLFFLGHSLGTSAALILCSLRPEYNEKFRLLLALGPLANVKHVLNPVHKFAIPLAVGILRSLVPENIHEVFPRRPQFTRLTKILCQQGSPLQEVCLALVFNAVGYDFPQLNTTAFVDFLRYYPSGTSTQLMLNVLQFYLTGKFARFDYGSRMLNILHYNQSEPSDYDLSKVRAPVSLHFGYGDFLVEEKDIDDLASKLPNVVGKFPVPYKYFNHFDFLLANDVRMLLYDSLISLMDKYK